MPLADGLCTILQANFGEYPSVLKNPFALTSAPSPGAKYDVSVVF